MGRYYCARGLTIYCQLKLNVPQLWICASNVAVQIKRKKREAEVKDYWRKSSFRLSDRVAIACTWLL